MKTRVGHAVNRVLDHFDMAVLRKSALDVLWEKADLLDRLLSKESAEAGSPSSPPDGTSGTECPDPDSPRLKELRAMYAAARHPATATALWTETYVANEVDFTRFRGDSAFVYQFRDLNLESAYHLAAYYVLQNDPHGLLSRLGEDGAFGASVFRFNEDLLVSRDLLDSVLEISFLDRHLGLLERSGLSMLDIGAGYGRLACRVAQAVPGLSQYLCVDAVPEATFLSEFYTRHRQAGDCVRVVPLVEIDDVLKESRPDIAVNIHSFSECTLATIEWWLDLVRDAGVPHLMIVPNQGDHDGTRLLSREQGREGAEFLPAVKDRGYELVVMEPKYLNPGVQRFGVSPTHYFLFRLES